MKIKKERENYILSINDKELCIIWALIKIAKMSEEINKEIISIDETLNRFIL